jgi:hypothetical protein
MYTIIFGLQGPYQMVKFAPFAFQIPVLLTIYLILRVTLKTNEANNDAFFVGLWFFLLANWMCLIYLSQQTIGYIFFLLLLYVCLKQALDSSKGFHLSFRIFSTLLIISIILSHILSSIVAITTLVILSLKDRKAYLILSLIGICTFIAWQIYGASTFFEGNLPIFMERTLRFDLLFQKGLAEHIAGSESRRIVSIFRIMTTLLFSLIAFTGFVHSYMREKLSRDNFILILLALASIIVFITIMPAYGTAEESFERLYFFLLPVMTCFTTKLFLYKRKIILQVLTLLFVFGLPLFFISNYGSQQMDYIMCSNLHGSLFLTDHINPLLHGEITSEGVFLIKNVELVRHYNIIPFELSRISEPKSLPQYVIISSHTYGYFYYIYGNISIVEQVRNYVGGSSFFLIYNNADVNIYVRQKV